MTITQKPRIRVAARTDATALIGTLASALKSLPDSKIDDLRDALDIDGPMPRDATGIGNYVPDSRESPTGDDLAASGDGAAHAVRVYSDTTDQGGITALYEQFARMLDDAKSEYRKSFLQAMQKNGDLEKAVQGLAQVVAELLGVSRSAIARASVAAPGPVQRDDETDDKEDEDDVEKSIRVGNIDLRGLMDVVSGRARQGAVPPDLSGLSAVRKAGRDEPADDFVTAEQSVARDVLAMRRHMVASGAWPEAAIKGLPNYNPSGM